MGELKIKKDRFTCDVFKVITSKRYSQQRIDSGKFHGYVGLVYINSVSNPQTWNYNNENTIFCNSNMKWLRILPDDQDYTIMAVINEKDEILVWYIDIICESGIDDDGVVYVNDLFLDLIVYPDGTIIIDDLDELELAYRKKVISVDLYERALKASEYLKTEVLSDINKFKVYCMKLYNGILKY